MTSTFDASAFPRAPEKPADHPPVKTAKTGVLLVNLGTPSKLEYGSVRTYLEEFLTDTRVIELPRALWLPILYLFVLTFRPRKTMRAYARIWDKERDESPIRTITRGQAEKLQARMGGDVVVDWAMRYGEPSIPDRMQALKEAGCTRIMVLPLYPQYAAPTTATVVDKVGDALRAMRWQPAVRYAPPFYDDELFCDAVADSLKAKAAELDWTPEEIILSYHGVPKSYLLKGDPYHCQCAVTTRLVKDRLPADLAKALRMTFQSRFGPEEWLQPYTDETLEALAHGGVKRVMIAAPSFVSDCIETLDELAIEGREEFEAAGGEKFAYVPCLNDGEAMIDVLEAISRRELGGWIDAAPAGRAEARAAAE